MYSNRAHIPSGSPFENDKMRSCMVHMQVTKYLGCTEYTSIRVGTRVLRTAGGISAFAFLHLVSLFFFFFFFFLLVFPHFSSVYILSLFPFSSSLSSLLPVHHLLLASLSIKSLCVWGSYILCFKYSA